MGKKVLMALGAAGLVALVVKEYPSMVREVKVWQMGSAPQGPGWHQRAGGN